MAMRYTHIWSYAALVTIYTLCNSASARVPGQIAPHLPYAHIAIYGHTLLVAHPPQPRANHPPIYPRSPPVVVAAARYHRLRLDHEKQAVITMTMIMYYTHIWSYDPCHYDHEKQAVITTVMLQQCCGQYSPTPRGATGKARP